jgi:hypothetical protein
MCREIGERAVQGLRGGQAVHSQQGGQQRLLEQSHMVRPTTAAPGEGEPDQAQHQRGQPPLAAVEKAFQTQTGRIGEQARQRGGVGGLYGGNDGQYTAHEDRAPGCGFSNPQDARFFLASSAFL